jgi:hypothetical protein
VQLIYNGISIDVMTVEEFAYDVVMDDSQTDLLFQRVRVLVSGLINGQAEVRALAGPPISVVDTGRTAFRESEAVVNRPAGVPFPAGGFAGPADTSVNPLRVAGAFRAPALIEFVTPYSGILPTPSYAKESRTVEVLTPGPNTPVLTTLLIQKRLTDPRGKLFVFSGTGLAPGELLLQSPGFDRHCDVRGGPKPTHFSLTQTHGDAASIFVQFGIETYIHTQKRSSATDPLLSNRFTMTHGIDKDSFLTVDVSGVAHFDLGLLHNLALAADAFRPNLFLPIPAGFTRDGIIVQEAADGSEIRYSFTDVQQHVNFAMGRYLHASRVSAIHRQSVLCDDDVLTGFTETTDRILSRKWQRAARDADDERRRLEGDSGWAKLAKKKWFGDKK